MKGLIIKEPWIDYILDNKKIWEIRGTATTIRGKILLIKSGTGCIWGEATLIDCVSVTHEQLCDSFDLHRIPIADISNMRYKKPYAWVLDKPRRFNIPIPYKHPNGAIIWVNIEGTENGWQNE